MKFGSVFGLVLLLATAAQGRIPDSLLAALPSPLNFLEQSNQAGSSVEKGMLKALVQGCNSRRDESCELPALTRQYSSLLAKLKSGANGISTQSKLPLKPWDLSVLIAGNFMFIPTEASVDEGRELLIQLFVLRARILARVEASYLRARNSSPKPVSPELMMMAPFMRAYFLTSTPLGALSETFRSLTCNLNDPACEIEKRIWGNVCHLAVMANIDAFSSLERRFNFITSDETSPELARTKLIRGLSDYIEKGEFDHDLLAAKLTELEGSGQGQSTNEDYAALTLSVLTFNEMKRLMELRYNCLAYRDDLSEKTKSVCLKRLAKLSALSLDSIEAALGLFASSQPKGSL